MRMDTRHVTSASDRIAVVSDLSGWWPGPDNRVTFRIEGVGWELVDGARWPCGNASDPRPVSGPVRVVVVNDLVRDERLASTARAVM